MPQNRTRPIAALWLCLAFPLSLGWGCGKGKPAEAPPPPPPLASVAQADFATSLAKAVCGVRQRCTQATSDAEQDCEAEVRGVMEPDLTKAVAAGDVTYDGVAAARCIAAYLAGPCDFRLSPMDQAACDGMLRGKVAQGHSCNFKYACLQGYCDASNGCPGTCPAVLAAGQACGSGGNATCDDRQGFECIQSLCAPRGSTGASCGSSSSACQGGLACQPISGQPGGTCQQPRTAGAACNDDDGCVNGLYCLNLCQQQVSAGGSCGEDLAHQDAAVSGSECASGLRCKGMVIHPAPPGGTQPPPTPGICTAPSDAGGTCVAGASVSGCKEGLLCQAGSCVAPPSSGPCVEQRCAKGVAYCDSSNTCQPLKANGAACAINTECASSRCDGTSHTCVDPYPPPACHYP